MLQLPSGCREVELDQESFDLTLCKNIHLVQASELTEAQVYLELHFTNLVHEEGGI